MCQTFYASNIKSQVIQLFPLLYLRRYNNSKCALVAATNKCVVPNFICFRTYLATQCPAVTTNRLPTRAPPHLLPPTWITAWKQITAECT